MKNYIIVLIVVGLIFLISAWLYMANNRYTIIKAEAHGGSEALYRLDKQTGDIWFVLDGYYTPVKGKPLP